MALSNNMNPKETLTSYQAFLDAMQAIKSFMTVDVERLSKDAAGLTEAVEAKAVDANKKIDDYRKIVAKQEAHALELEAIQDNIDLREADLKKANVALDEKSKAFNVRKEELDNLSKSLNQKSNELSKANEDLRLKTEKVEQDRIQLQKERAEFEDEKIALKEKEDKLKNLLNG